jgi:hypothetical protein
MDYFDLDLVSNSRLNIVYNIVHGMANSPISKENAEFGRLLHEYVFEPENYDCNNEYHERVRAMGEAAKKNVVLKMVLANKATKKEMSHFFTHERTMQHCKIKVDSLLYTTVYDLKSTTCTSEEDFRSCMVQYGYHRQAAFYMDPLDCKRMVFIAVNKKHPYATFTIALDETDPLISQGRKEIEFLMDEHAKMINKGVNFQKLMYAK